jgi:hypothetical protein
VIVFTHDDRLPEAVRRLGIPATVLEVARRSSSVVSVRPRLDPVLGHLDDALAVARTKGLPADVAARVVPGFCRLALEAACMSVVRRKRLGRGEPHEDVEALLSVHGKTHPLMALALFDDESRTNDVLPRLEKIGKWAPAALQACKSGAHGAHGAYAGDLDTLVKDVQRLAEQIVAAGK